MHRNKSVSNHNFAMVPKADIPRSTFKADHALKTTFDSGYLVPIYLDEILPGDSVNINMTGFARLTTPIYPIMDNLHYDTFFFFVPRRLLWSNWKRLMGERDNPEDSIDFTEPQTVSPAGGYPANSLQDYFGLPTVGQVVAGASVEHSALPLRAYNLIYNEWFRDQNLVDRVPFNTGDGPDDHSNFTLLRRGKRHDYFTSCLPSPQKGQPVSIPLTGDGAVVYPTAGSFVAPLQLSPSYASTHVRGFDSQNAANGVPFTNQPFSSPGSGTNYIAGAYVHTSALASLGGQVNLSDVTVATINELRTAFQIQKLLERDMRGGTRYTEIVRSHFGVISPDARQQRPEYIGGGSSPVNISPVAQTSATGLNGGTSPLGTLSAFGTILSRNHRANYHATEHGFIIGLCMVRADLTYQQGLPKLWSRKTRYDHYFPAFAHLGEQAVLNKEIYCDGSAADEDVFGYQERWAELRYKPSRITGQFRSTYSQPLDAWHLAQRFTTRPNLNKDFIEENPPLDRVLAVGGAAGGQQFYLDCFFDVKMARQLPMYSVPGLIDHF